MLLQAKLHEFYLQNAPKEEVVGQFEFDWDDLNIR
jgi:hypothetical protein